MRTEAKRDSTGQDLVPFGKYRDRPVADLLADRNYVEWLLAQPWFSQRQSNIYNIVVGTGVEVQDTPEHNAMQARFLEPNTCDLLARRYLLNAEELAVWVRKRDGREPSEDACYRISVTPPTFEDGGWDVAFVALADLIDPAQRGSTYYGVSDHDDYKRLFVELKPSLGDDYPTVLRDVVSRRARQLRGSGLGMMSHWLVLADKLMPSSVSVAEMRSVFASQQVDLVSWADLTTAIPGPRRG